MELGLLREEEEWGGEEEGEEKRLGLSAMGEVSSGKNTRRRPMALALASGQNPESLFG